MNYNIERILKEEKEGKLKIEIFTSYRLWHKMSQQEIAKAIEASVTTIARAEQQGAISDKIWTRFLRYVSSVK